MEFIKKALNKLIEENQIKSKDILNQLFSEVQNRVLYKSNSVLFPKKPNQNELGYQNPAQQFMPYEDIYLPTSDGQFINCWFLKQKTLINTPTALFFHENIGNMGLRMKVLIFLYKICGFNVFAIDYRGYGNSSGVPSEQGLQIDAQTSLDYLLRSQVDQSKIFVLGKSLGGAVAINLLSKELNEQKVKALVLENTFTSISDIIDSNYSILSPYKKDFLQIQ